MSNKFGGLVAHQPHVVQSIPQEEEVEALPVTLQYSIYLRLKMIQPENCTRERLARIRKGYEVSMQLLQICRQLGPMVRVIDFDSVPLSEKPEWLSGVPTMLLMQQFADDGFYMRAYGTQVFTILEKELRRKQEEGGALTKGQFTKDMSFENQTAAVAPTTSYASIEDDRWKEAYDTAAPGTKHMHLQFDTLNPDENELIDGNLGLYDYSNHKNTTDELARYRALRESSTERFRTQAQTREQFAPRRVGRRGDADDSTTASVHPSEAAGILPQQQLAQQQQTKMQMAERILRQQQDMFKPSN